MKQSILYLKMKPTKIRMRITIQDIPKKTGISFLKKFIQ